MPVITVPPAFGDLVRRREGPAGHRWLLRLPTLVEDLLQRWHGTLDGPVRHGGVALVVPLRVAEGAAVLKVSFPHPGNLGEAPALRLLDGRGTVRVFDADDAEFALLLERAGPYTLACVPSAAEGIEVAGALARRLAVPASDSFARLADTSDGWQEQLEQQVAARPGLIPPAALARARATITALGADRTETLVHGDLHAGNVLAADREPWLAIDPKGWRGTAAYDAFTVVADHRDELRGAYDPVAELGRRVRRYADAAGLEVELALACCQARAVSSLLYETLQSGSWFDLDLLQAAVLLR